MNVIVIDDEILLLNHLVKLLKELLPEANIMGFENCNELLEYSNDNFIDIAFLDIQMMQMSGLELAKKLTEIYPKINIIFTTGFDNYAVEAFNIFASGYLLKPITKDDIKTSLKNLRYPIIQKTKVKLQCFGNFEIFVNTKPLEFTFTKTKELLAYLVYKQGALCSNEEIIAVLWDDDKEHLSYYKQLRQDLIKTLIKSNCENIIIRQRGKIAIYKDIVECDYYDYLNGKPAQIKEFMNQYSWGEEVSALLQNA